MAILSLVLSSSFVMGRKPAFPPLPSPNAYDDFLSARKSASGPIGDFPVLSKDELRELLATNVEALRIVRQGFTHTCSVPTEAAITNFSAMINDLADFKALAQLLAAEGRLAELEGRPGDAAESYCDAMRLGNEISHGGFLIYRLVGVAIEAIGGSRLAKVSPELNPAQRTAVIARLETLEDARVTWEEVMRNENAFARHELRKGPNVVKLIISWWSARPAKAKAKVRHDLALAHLRLNVTELALQAYLAQNGRSPPALAELVPKYLKRAPLDPFSEQPMVYRPQGTNWLLYSLGPDKIDNGGQPAGRGSGSGDVFYNSTW